MLKAISIVAMSAAMAACSSFSGIQYAMAEYNGIKPLDYSDAETGAQYRVFDKPASSKMMITASHQTAAAQGLVWNLRSQPEPYTIAALNWLEAQGRNCTATSTTLVLELQWEVAYACT